MRFFSQGTGSRRAFNTTVLAVGMMLGTAGAVYAPSALAQSRVHTIVIKAMKFSPEVLEVKPGDIIVWENKDAFPHTAVAENAAFKSPEIASDGSWKTTMHKKGTYAYICTLHPTMKATLIVK